MGVHFIRDLTKWLNLYSNSPYCYILNVLVKVWQKSVFRKHSSYISSYQRFKELQYVDLLLLDLRRITNNLQGFKELQYVDLQLDLERTATEALITK